MKQKKLPAHPSPVKWGVSLRFFATPAIISLPESLEYCAGKGKGKVIPSPDSTPSEDASGPGPMMQERLRRGLCFNFCGRIARGE